jgi:hypothetical protein
MSRLDDIRARLAAAYLTRNGAEEFFENAPADIAYLLEQIALRDVALDAARAEQERLQKTNSHLEGRVLDSDYKADRARAWARCWREAAKKGRGVAEVYQEYVAAVREAHTILDGAGVPSAHRAVCDDPNCKSKLGHRIRALVAARNEAVSSADAARAEVQRARYAEGEALRKVERLQVIKVVE